MDKTLFLLGPRFPHRLVKYDYTKYYILPFKIAAMYIIKIVILILCRETVLLGTGSVLMTIILGLSFKIKLQSLQTRTKM